MADPSVTTITVKLSESSLVVRDDRLVQAKRSRPEPASQLIVPPPPGRVRTMLALGGEAFMQAPGGAAKAADVNHLGDHGFAVSWALDEPPEAATLKIRLTEMAHLGGGKQMRLKTSDADVKIEAVAPPTLRGWLDSRLKREPLVVIDVATSMCQLAVAWLPIDKTAATRSYFNMWPTLTGPHVLALQKVLANALLDRDKQRRGFLCGELTVRDLFAGMVGTFRVKTDDAPRWTGDGLSVTNGIEVAVRADLEPHVARCLDRDKSAAERVVDHAAALTAKRAAQAQR